MFIIFIISLSNKTVQSGRDWATDNPVFSFFYNSITIIDMLSVAGNALFRNFELQNNIQKHVYTIEYRRK